MKKAFSLVLMCMVLCVVPLSSCDYNAPLRNRMTEHYSQDENYSEVRGIIRDIFDYGRTASYNETEISIQIIEGLPDYYYRSDPKTGCRIFSFICQDFEQFGLEIGEEIVFMSSPEIFYNGHCPPIISLRRENEMLITFEDGKNTYTNWINEEFD